jgi:hypothetical protein
VSPWRVAFVDAVTAHRIEVDVNAADAEAVRERGREALRAARPTGLVVVVLVDIRPAETSGWIGPEEGGRS